MTRRPFSDRLLLVALLAAGLGVPATSFAAEFTELVDAADDFDDLDEETFDPFDLHLEPTFTFKYGTAQITREAPCVGQIEDGESALVRNNPRLEVAPGRCSEPTIIYNKEMEYVGTRSQIDLKLRAGLFKDLELHFNVPYVFVNSRSLSYDDGDSDPAQNVTELNSSVDPRVTCDPADSGRCVQREAEQVFSPGDTRQQQIDKLDRFSAYRLFELGDQKEYVRSGFAEPSIGLHWSVFNDERDPTKANLLLGFDYVMPIVPIAREDNSAVGRGMHEFQFKIASSKKFGWIEPYFGVEYFLPVARDDSPLRENLDGNNDGQVFTSPPMRGEVTFGTEFIPYENKELGQRYGIDLRFTFGYVSEGRDYSPVYDHFAVSSCNNKTMSDVLPQFDTNGQLSNPDHLACASVLREPGNTREQGRNFYDLGAVVDDDDIYNNVQFAKDGIMTVESYGTFRGMLGFYLQPARNFQLKAVGQLEHQQEHFLTNARTGRDTDDAREETNDETVDLEGADASIERNPVYNPTVDSSGERLRVQNFNTWIVMVTAALQF